MAWIALLDRREGRLLEASTTDAGRLHLEQRDRLEERWDEHEHLRLAPSLSRDRGAHTDWEGQKLERLRRFGRLAADWLESQLTRRQIERLPVFCAPDVLGELRAGLSPALAARLDLHNANFTGETLAELATQRRLTAVLEATHDRDR